MSILIVVNDPREWPFEIPDVQVVDARSYLTKTEYSEMRSAKVINLCRSYRYQTTGYYVSLLAEARGHKPQPSVSTIQDIKSQAMMRLVSGELDELMQKSLSRIQSDKFTLSIYFGRNLAKRYDRLALQLFNMFQSPLLRAQFGRDKDQRGSCGACRRFPQAEFRHRITTSSPTSRPNIFPDGVTACGASKPCGMTWPSCETPKKRIRRRTKRPWRSS